MTSETEKMPELKHWRYSINYGPDGEANYANVYDGSNFLVGNLKIYHAIEIVRNANSTYPVNKEAVREALDAVIKSSFVSAIDPNAMHIKGINLEHGETIRALLEAAAK